MAGWWLLIDVELVHGTVGVLWPRPGRVVITPPTATFAELALEIDRSLGRWNVARSRRFVLGDCTEIVSGEAAPPEGVLQDEVTLERLRTGERFAYEFDLTAGWGHLCTVHDETADPAQLVSRPAVNAPTTVYGWGDLPDQDGRTWRGDDGTGRPPLPPRDLLGELPPLLPGWGDAHLRGGHPV